MNEKSSIEKLDEQIKMLSTKNFVKKDKIVRKESFVKERKVILEEPTKDSLLSDLVTDDESTKVFDKDKTMEIEKTKEIVEDDNNDNDNKKDLMYDVVLPIIVTILIIVLILLIIFI